MDWEWVSNQLFATFKFTSEIPMQKYMLLTINTFIFNQQPEDLMQKVICTYHKSMVKLNQLVYSCKVDNNDAKKEDPQSLQINEIESECVVQGNASCSIAPDYTCLLNMKK